MDNRAFLSLGSNIENREQFLKEAIRSLMDNGRIRVTNYSSIYETDPVGYANQNCFLNMAIEIVTDYKAEELLYICLNTEKQLGRKRVIHWGPRTVDIDIILFNQEVIKTDHLIVPHPRMTERAFVLVPLVEIDPTIHVPDANQTAGELLKFIPSDGVRLWKRKKGKDVNELFQTVLES